VPDAISTHALRTPIGRYGGALVQIRPDDLAALVIRALIARSGIDPQLIEDVASSKETTHCTIDGATSSSATG
jgi:acetyl-CoA acetyltransferase